jgi:predicted O-methyltransferase YrrM
VILPLEIIKYYLVAKGRHGIHSPFAYDFIDKCVRIKLDDEFIKKRNLVYSTLIHSSKVISIQDFGAGSKKMGNKRLVSSIFKNSSSKGKYADLLYRISNFYKPNHILELGTSLGIGTIHLQAGYEKSSITTIEACEETLKIAEENFEKFNFKVTSKLNKFDEYISSLKEEKFDLIYIDGHHDGIALKRYIEKLLPHIHNETLLLLDDIRWSNSMLKAWEELKKSELFHVSFDLFRIGILTPRKQQAKEHFVFRY